MSRTVLISGLGLMGGSLAAALSAADWQVFLHHRRPEVARDAAARGWGTAVAEPAEAQAAIAVLGVPVEVVPDQVRLLAATTDALITDMASTKAGICTELADLGDRFIGSHPMCGSHLTGLAHADPQLFADATAVVTPLPEHDAQTVELIDDLWRAAGAVPHRLAPADHDLLVAEASHLPHVLACVAASLPSDAALKLAAGGFRDTSRKAAGSPELWRQILLQNADAIQPAIARAKGLLDELAEALQGENDQAVTAWLERARDRRSCWNDTNGAPTS